MLGKCSATECHPQVPQICFNVREYIHIFVYDSFHSDLGSVFLD
jgi:hypothetical protein